MATIQNGVDWGSMASPSYRNIFTRERRHSLQMGILIFVLALMFQMYSLLYTERVTTNFVHDFFLDNLPILDLNVIIVEGALTVLVGTLALVLSKPAYIIFALKAVALFIATRAIFISLTHLGIYPGQINPDRGLADHIYIALGLEAGFFFSAHTGLPILMSLIFWRERIWRTVYLGIALIFGASVLLAHVHYSIDVFAAPFMAYSIYKLTEYLFPEDAKLRLPTADVVHTA